MQTQTERLSQPHPAFFADPPVDIVTKAFPAGGAYPVLGGIADVCGDNNSLGPEECAF